MGDLAWEVENLWWVGVLCSLLACFATVSGVILQKFSHTRNARMPAGLRRPVYKRKLWW